MVDGRVPLSKLSACRWCLVVCWGLAGISSRAVWSQEVIAVPGPAASPAGPTPPGVVAPGTPPVTVGPDGKPIVLPVKPGDPAKPADAGIKVIRRTELLKTPGSSDKITIPLGADGKVEFNFQSTPWPPVLDWLAEVSGKSLDWQELPGDYLNLHTQKRYTPEQARDLLNWHLLARGYTLLLHDEVFTVAAVKGINPGIVPRVTVEELSARMPNEFVKLSLPLDWIIAEDAATQLAPMLSPNGKLSAIKSVNRIEAIDAVANLRDIVALLDDEQSNQKQDRALVREFKLVHVRADDVVLSLMAILGLEKKATGGSGGGDMNGMMQMMQQQMQQQMQQMQQPGGGGGTAAPKASEPKLVVNSRENSILAHAPPDKMEIIAQTVQALDVAGGTDGQILRNLDRMRVYRLKTLNPGPLAEILTDVGDLSPGARIRVDKDNNSIVLFGSLSDHVTVQALVDKLDGSPRNFEVIALRRLRADEVAGSIQFMLGPEEKKETQRSRWSYYDSYGSNNEETTRKDERPFRVDADVENNRLLVWANEVELGEVQGLLSKMGEIPNGETNPQSTRTLEFASPEEADRMLKQLRQLWPNVSPNELLMPEVEPSTTPKAPAREADPPSDAALRSRRTPARFSQLETVLAEAEDEAPVAPLPRRHPLADDDAATAAAPSESLPAAAASGIPPIAMYRLPDGRVIIGSADTRALDQLELLVRDLRPKNPDFRVFHLKNSNTWAYGLELNLKDFFDTEEDDKTILDWYGDVVSTKDKTPSRLSKRRKLKIISDSESRTILVQNATAEQLVIIEELIEVYDLPESNDPRAIRVTRIFGLKYSQASVISDTVKSVYRDLLSSSDPALQPKGDDKQPPQSQGPSTSYIFGRSNTDTTKKDEPKETPIRFKGLLSIGVDEISNSLVVSSASGLMEDISQLIESLDKAAKPSTKFEVMQLNSRLDAATVQEKLSSLLGAGKKAKIRVSSSGEKPK